MEIRASTRAGRVEGLEQSGVAVFRGIPYAAPPEGALRFRPPRPARSWPGLRPARRFGPSAPQSGPVGRLVRQFIGTASTAQGEDCLSLSVWTPGVDAGRRSVLVWIHGGAFVMGSGATRLYDGARLARRGDVVVVTLNYRLGALGFLSPAELRSGAEEASANLGIRDQIAALEWVRDNIEGFGGDPEQVTLFGESAGGMSVGTLLGTPRARGLFQRAILQSGAAHNTSSPERAAQVTGRFLSELGLARVDLEVLRKTPVSEILRAQNATSLGLGMVSGSLPWQPSVDGDLLPEPPIRAIAEGRGAAVPILVGTNRDEWKLFTLGDTGLSRMDEAHLRRRLGRTLPGSAPDGRLLGDHAYELYRGLGGDRRALPPRERWIAFQSDRVFHAPALRLAELQSAVAPAYSYLFDWAPPLLRGRIGACHGIEIPFVFGTLRDPWLRPLLGLTRAARSLSRRVQEGWLRFAKTGHPGHAGLPPWQSYTCERRSSMVLGSDCHLREDLFEQELRFWSSILG